MRLLDVGCGWGGMVMHAATHHGVEAVGRHHLEEQHDYARKRVAEAGLGGRVDVRLQDYRELAGERVRRHLQHRHGRARRPRASSPRYFGVARRAAPPTGRLLNHAISTPNGASFDRRTFIARYVFPDGELPDVAEVVTGMQAHGLDVRDVEALREHYALTLRRWSANLEAAWDDACRLVGERRARVWRLYLAGAAVSFEIADIGIHQVLGVKLTAGGDERDAADPGRVRPGRADGVTPAPDADPGARRYPLLGCRRVRPQTASDRRRRAARRSRCCCNTSGIRSSGR